MPSFISFYEPGLAYVASAKIDASSVCVVCVCMCDSVREERREKRDTWQIRWQIEETFPLNIFQKWKACKGLGIVLAYWESSSIVDPIRPDANKVQVALGGRRLQHLCRPPPLINKE